MDRDVNSPDAGLSGGAGDADEATGAAKDLAATWSEQEHVSEQVQIEAQKLVEQAGTPELAKQAIDVAGQRLQGSENARQASADARQASESAASQSSPTATNARAAMEGRARLEEILPILQDFERELGSPLVAGEMAEWLAAVIESCDRVGQALSASIGPKHEEMYAAILQEDREQASRVENLRAVDARLMEDHGKIRSTFAELAERAEDVESDELKLKDPLQDNIASALSLMINIRMQDAAVGTWFVEAFNRERGVAD